VVLIAGCEILIRYEALIQAHQVGLNLVEVTNENHPKEL